MNDILNDKDAMWYFIEALRTGDSGQAVVNQERHGQQVEAARQTLPREMNGITREQMEALGFVFGEPADDLFVYVAFPMGWHKRPTEHAMHTDLIDDKGRTRGGIFYKAAFYDRNAHLHMATRYSYGVEPVGGYGEHFTPNETRRVAYVSDQGARIFESEPVVIERGEYEKRDALHKQAADWIAEHYPQHKDPTAYWDDASE